MLVILILEAETKYRSWIVFLLIPSYKLLFVIIRRIIVKQQYLAL